jgi:hypothetical protein
MPISIIARHIIDYAEIVVIVQQSADGINVFLTVDTP